MNSQRKRCNDKIRGDHSSLKVNETMKSKSKTQVVFYMFLSLFLTIWPIVQPFSHTVGSVSYTGFLTEERRKEKGALLMKVMFVLIVHKKEVPAGSNRGQRMYNHSIKQQHPLLERNYESVTRSWKDSWTCTELVFLYLWDCVCTWPVQVCL